MSTGDQHVQTAADVWAGALDERDATIRELQAELARVRALGLDATDRAERLASALNDLRAENERLRRERDAKAEPEHPDFQHQSPRVAIEAWNKQLRDALGLPTFNEHPISETADAVSDVLRLVSVLREQVEALRRERDEARATTILAVSGVSAVDALKAMTAERDEWKAKAEQCDDCENFAGIRVCTGCWAKHVAAAHDAARARVAKVEAEQDKARADWQTLWADQHHYVGPCAACAGSGETTDARPCPGCAGTGDKYETWKATAGAAVSRAAALEAACRFTVAMEADADDAYRRLKRAAFACQTALKGDTAALVERIATAVEGLERWRSEPAERADDGEMLDRDDVLATIRGPKGGAA